MSAARATIGRIVLYKSLGDSLGKYPPQLHPAIVLDGGEEAELFVITQRGFFWTMARHDEEGAPGTWRWPVIV